MGQKVNPNGLRLGIVKSWSSIWYANKKNFPKNVINDFKVREYFKKKLEKSFLSKIEIERLEKNIRVTVYTSRPGLIIGKKGEDVEKLRKKVEKITGLNARIKIMEIRRPEIDSKLVANNVVLQIKRRVSFRKIIKRSVQSAIRSGAQGAKIEVSGRLGGSEIARTEWHREGRIPLHTLRADIDYHASEAHTTYGVIGVKVWIFKGEIFNFYSNEKQKERFISK